MPFTDTPLVAGATMVWEDLAANFRHARTWLNAVPVTDFADAVIQREHLVRPSIVGFPVQGTTGTFQSAYRATSLGISPPTPREFTQWGPKIDRLTIKPECCRGPTASVNSVARWVTPIGVPLHLARDADIAVVIQFDLLVRSDSTGPFFPDGVGGGSTAGDFRLLVHDRAADTEDLRQIRQVYPLEASVPGPQNITTDHVRICSTFPLDAGDYDLALVYFRGNAADLVVQLDLTNLTFHVEVI